jgi:hypothetical protein
MEVNLSPRHLRQVYLHLGTIGETEGNSMNKFLGYRCSLCGTEYSSTEVTYTCRPTMRAVDRWVRAAFFELFPGFEFFSFRRRVSAHPPATNASR